MRVSDKVYVLSKRGKPLMPCSPCKAKRLLKQGKAIVKERTPFTIKLTIGTGETIQPITLGVDSGYSKVGFSSLSVKEELFCAEVKLRSDIKRLLAKRKICRKGRRHRNTWYRKPRFLNRKKPKGWLAPSIQNKLDSHIRVINQVKGILPVSHINIEVAAFDIQKIKNPDIEGAGYRNGEQKGFWNVREYVLYRDGHICRHCKGTSKDKVLQVHHIVSRQTGGDRPGNLITLCRTCHKRVSIGKLKLNLKPSKGFKAETFMSIVRWRLINKLRAMGNVVSHTYGYITKGRRIELGLPKSHINDAFVIAGGKEQIRSSVQYFIRQVRNCNRADVRSFYGFKRHDRVLWKDAEYFILGRRTVGYFSLMNVDKTKVCSTKYCNLVLLERSKSFLIEKRFTDIKIDDKSY